MFKKIRREDRVLDEKGSVELLKKCEYGILSTIGEDGYPYGIPISYAYDDGMIYFHCAKDVGHKLENLKFNNKASFTVVGETKVISSAFSTDYESVVVFGKISPLDDKIKGLEKIVKKYSPEYVDKGKKYAENSKDNVGVYVMKIEHISGKAKKRR